MATQRQLSLFLAGDALIVEPWSQIDDPAFLRLVAEMRAADVAIVNLETVIHDFKGYAQADSGGTYMASPPSIAGELAWAGVDMVSSANNHAFDYGTEGILETLEHVAAAGLALAGTGRDLQAARAPAVVTCRAGTVSMVSMAWTFVGYGRASRSRPDMRGRPGLNPLAPTRRAVATITPSMARVMARLQIPRRRTRKAEPGVVRLFGLRWLVGDRVSLRGVRGVDPADLAANLDAIDAAVASADLAVVSLHIHQNPGWLRGFAHGALDRGAAIVFMHGPHEVRGIEIRGGKPIFYGMGDFVYETEKIARFPSQYYEIHNLRDDATPRDLLALREKSPHASRTYFESCCAVLHYENRTLRCIRLLPLDLQFDAPADIRGRPHIAGPALGRKIIERVAELFRAFGTTIRYDAESNEGTIDL